MGAYGGPDIPTNGLVLALDATSERSYPGSGTTWYDLSGKGNNATLNNGTSWNSSGYMSTDGIDDYISIPNDSSLQVTTGFTQVIWVKLNNITASGYAQLFGKPGYTKYGMIVEWYGGNPILFDFANSSGRNTATIMAGSGSWIMVAQSYNAAGGSNNRICNIRGGVTNTAVQTKTGNVLTDSSDMAIGGPRSEADFGLALLYNRGLTQAELDQIYNAQKKQIFIMYTGPHIVTDGLVFAVDAGSERSYAGTGTTWKDLSATGINGTLTNGPTFNSSNGGSFLFDNTDDYVSLGASSELSITNQISVFSWVKVNTFSAWDGVFGAYDGGNFIHFQLSYGRLSVYVYGPNAGYGSLDSGYDQLTAGEWSNIGFTFGSQTLTVYLNGVAMPTTVTGSSADINGTSEMSIGRVYSGSRYFGGNLANTMVYNKALSQAEVTQNYNAEKSRFL